MSSERNSKSKVYWILWKRDIYHWWRSNVSGVKGQVGPWCIYLHWPHICHLPFYHHIMQDPFLSKNTNKLQDYKKIALYWPVATYIILPFMMLKSPCTAIKHKINAIWAETFTHWMSVLIFIESKKRGKLIFLLMRSIPSKVSCVWYTTSRPVKSPFHSLKSLLPIQY